MEEKIKKYIQQLEEERGIKVLLACETGSRAWGFPSPDSDYDVRIIYKHPKNWYLKLGESKDTIDVFYENNDIDISGWDLRKSLRLLWKSNAPLLERIQSSIIYKADEAFVEEINEVAQKTYSRIATIHHYLSMAKKMMEIVKGSEEYKLKKFFYALRTSVACLWILEREEIPPIAFRKMLEGLSLPISLVERIKELIELKETVDESYFHKGEEEVITFMRSCIERADNESKSLPSAKKEMKVLDEFFIKILENDD
ncbi:MAG: nucleotidyltransferase domain-containing protein [Cytophagales bacterium]|nr:nucleotidyltransferase domain-containing protein [Cytophagales bacterium]